MITKKIGETKDNNNMENAVTIEETKLIWIPGVIPVKNPIIQPSNIAINISNIDINLILFFINTLEKKWKKEPVYSSMWLDRIVLYGEENLWKMVLERGEPA